MIGMGLFVKMILLVTLAVGRKRFEGSRPQHGVKFFEGMEPVSRRLVKAGDNITLPCAGDQEGEGQEWFFCLWRHPSGGKECSVQVIDD